MTVTDQTITRDDLTVEYGTARWGGPTATVTVNAGALAGRRFWLRSTQGLEHETTSDLTRGGGIHLDAYDPDSSYHGWRGSFKTFDMNEAIGLLVGYVNDVAARERVREATWSETHAVSDALSALNDALEEYTTRDWRDEWQRVQRTVAALALKIEETSRG
jgi:hypothetical protein